MLFVALLFFVPVAIDAVCHQPVGIDFGDGRGCELNRDCVPFSSFTGIVENFVLRTVVQEVAIPKPGLSGLETPIINHWTACNIGQVYSSMAAYEPFALELWGRQNVSDERRRCSSELTNLSEDELQLHRRVTLAYTCLWVFSRVHKWEDPIGGAEVPLRALASSWGIDFDICDLNRKSPQDRVNSCHDIMTPWGLALELVQEIVDWMKRDGWNRNGDLSGARNNKVPYKDWRSVPNRYVPVNNPWTLADPTKWQPLMEHNNVGFLFHQEHVTPHIGDTAVSIFFPDDEICKKSDALPSPNYDFDQECDAVLERVANLDQRQKARIELFDDKLNSLSPAMGQYYGRTKVFSDDFEFVVAQAANIHAIREATILVWKAKVEHNSVRPSTYIRSQYPGRMVTSYGGPKIGKTTELRAKDWQGYKRVMPHAEYPSGSSCICRAFADAMKVMTGVEGNFTKIPSLVLTREAGTSGVENNMPETPETFLFYSWDQIVEECGQSRLDGGMHFTGAVPAGEELCSNVGGTVATAFLDLAHGVSPNYLVDFESPLVKEIRCDNPVGYTTEEPNGVSTTTTNTPKQLPRDSTQCPLTPSIDGPECRPLLVGDGQEIGQVCAKIIDDNLEITKYVSSDMCCLTESHICNIPMNSFALDECVQKFGPIVIPISVVYQFVCSFEEDQFLVAGHATAMCGIDSNDVLDAGDSQAIQNQNEQGSAYYEIPLKCQC